MSWLRNHLRHFTVPGIKAIVDAYKKAGIKLKKDQLDLFHSHLWNVDSDKARVSVTAADIGPPIGMRSSKEAVCSEAGYILSALESFGIVGDLEPETLSGLKNLDPQYFITASRYELTNSSKGVEVKKEDQIHNIIKKSFSSLRRILEAKPNRRLVLTGRDVWLWEVMARKKDVPTIFDPRVSRKVAVSSVQFDELVKTWNIDAKTIIFDTGFAGSIYNAICRSASRVSGRDVKGINLMLSTNCKSENGESQQIYPNHKNARAKALAIEYLPKYQKSGTVKDGHIIQYLSDLDEFIKAAALTIWFWHHESPRWIDQGGTRCKGVACPGCKCCKLWRKDVTVKEETDAPKRLIDWP